MPPECPGGPGFDIRNRNTIEFTEFEFRHFDFPQLKFVSTTDGRTVRRGFETRACGGKTVIGPIIDELECVIIFILDDFYSSGCEFMHARFNNQHNNIPDVDLQ